MPFFFFLLILLPFPQNLWKSYPLFNLLFLYLFFPSLVRIFLHFFTRFQSLVSLSLSQHLTSPVQLVFSFSKDSTPFILFFFLSLVFLELLSQLRVFSSLSFFRVTESPSLPHHYLFLSFTFSCFFTLFLSSPLYHIDSSCLASSFHLQLFRTQSGALPDDPVIKDLTRTCCHRMERQHARSNPLLIIIKTLQGRPFIKAALWGTASWP